MGVDVGVKSGLDLIGLNPSTQSSHRPSLTPATGSRLSLKARGVAVTPPPPALQDSCGTRRSGLPPPRHRAGGDRRGAELRALGCWVLHSPHPKPLHPPAGQGKCSPGAAEPPSSPAPCNRDPWKEGVKRKKVREDLGARRFGRRRSATPHPPPPAVRPAPSSRGRELGPSGRARPGAGGIRCRRQLPVRRARARSERPAGPAINNAAAQPGVAQPWPARSPGTAGTAPPRPRGRTVQGPRRGPVGRGRWTSRPPTPREHLSPGWGWWASRGVALAPGGATGRGRWERPGVPAPPFVCGFL